MNKLFLGATLATLGNIALMYHFGFTRPVDKEPYTVEYRMEGCRTADDINVKPLRTADIEEMIR